MIDKNLVLESLKEILDKESKKNIVDLGIVSSIIVNPDQISLALNFQNKDQAKEKYYLKEICETTLKKSFSIESVKVIITYSSSNSNNSRKLSIPNVKNIILISSGKGGVGKSTIATYVALSLSKLKYKVGLLDADIYGPSIPSILGLEKDSLEIKNNKMLPIEKHGIYIVSIGCIIDKENALIWRGPMITKALQNLILGTEWQNLDYLIIDTPPGTGDIHLSLTEKFEIQGAVLVSTPQKLSVIHTIKSSDLLKKMNIPILGIVENMSYFIDEISHNKTHIFSEKGGEEITEYLHTKLLGKIPIDSKICKSSEQGNPLLIEKFLFEKYLNISKNILFSLNELPNKTK